MTTQGIPASGGSQTSIPSQGGQSQGGQASDPRVSQLEQALAQQAKQSEELKGTLGKLQNVFTGEGQTEDPDAWYDDILRIGLEAEKAGQGMPVTIDLATRVRKQAQENKELRDQIKRLDEMVKKGVNPETLHNQRVFENIDSHIISGVQDVYGEESNEIINVLANKISAEIRDLRQNKPAEWDAIRRDPNAQKKLVNRHLLNMIPKHVREQMRADDLKNTPLTINELAEAMVEARRIQNPAKRAKVMEHIRQSYWEAKFGENKSKSFEGRMNRYAANRD